MRRAIRRLVDLAKMRSDGWADRVLVLKLWTLVARVWWAAGVAAMVLVSLGAGCGGGQRYPPIDTGVAGDKPVGGLSDPESGTLCQDVIHSEVFQDLVSDGCQFAALLEVGLLAASPAAMVTDAQLRDACTSLATQCRSAALRT